MNNRNLQSVGRRPDRSGFTLVEILVAIFIFSVLLLPLTALLIADSKFAAKHEQKVIAMLVAKNEMEKAKKMVGTLEEGDYAVTMADKAWNVSTKVETEEGALLDTFRMIKKTYVTIGVRRENDTVTLSEFRILRETWR
ncbi:MAG: prepilin-type N-terminal cleavage/methylation domain-containing protein [Chitinispirillaceae bacterium]|nr:prepilin-type N-terminal cleavage/methylation domain-containing protein [Chitinispirillaceae bacterium]